MFIASCSCTSLTASSTAAACLYLKVCQLVLEVLEIDIKIRLAMLQGVIGFLLQCGSKEAEPSIEGLNTLNPGETQCPIGGDCVHEL